MHIFVSYSRKDEPFVQQLVEKLQAAGYPVWMDREGIVGGDEWRTKLKVAVEEASLLLLVVSPQSEKSEWVTIERSYAKEKGIPILPLLYRGQMWWDMPHVQYVDLTNIDTRRPWELPADLIRAVNRYVKAEEGNQKDEALLMDGPAPSAAETGHRNSIQIQWIALGSLVVAALVFLFGDGVLRQQPIESTDVAVLTETMERSTASPAPPTATSTSTQRPTRAAAPTSTASAAILPTEGAAAEPEDLVSALSQWIAEQELGENATLMAIAQNQNAYLGDLPSLQLADTDWCLNILSNPIDLVSRQFGYSGTAYIVPVVVQDGIRFSDDVLPFIPDGFPADEVGYDVLTTGNGREHLVLVLGDSSGEGAPGCTLP